MSSVHTIRLRDPWDVQTLLDGRTEYRRKFGKPRLADNEVVWLVCSDCADDSTFELNGDPLPSAVSDITSRMLPRNELRIVVPEGSPFGTVALEIRTPG